MDPELEPDSAAKEAGFTLIELLISIAILAVLVLGASLALPRSSPPVDSDMALFQRQFEQMRQLAISGQSSRGLVISAEGLQLTRMRTAAPEQGSDTTSGIGTDPGWHIAARPQRWQGRVLFVPQPNQPGQPAHPGRRGGGRPADVQFLADGRNTAFSIHFSPRSGALRPGGGARRASCHSDGRTGLICDRS